MDNLGQSFGREINLGEFMIQGLIGLMVTGFLFLFFSVAIYLKQYGPRKGNW